MKLSPILFSPQMRLMIDLRRKYAQNEDLSAKRRMLFRPVYYKDNQLNILLMWICIGVPYGIRRMFLWLVPHKYDLAGTVGVVALDVVLGGIIGGFALIFQILRGVIETVKG